MFKRTPGKKYNSTKTIIDGYTFRSKLEARIYQYLVSKDYNIVEHEPSFLLQGPFTIEGKKYREIKYKSDFLIEIGDKNIIIEVKGFETPEWKIKKKLFLYKLKDFEKEYDCKLQFIVCKSIKDLEKQLNEF